MYAAPHASEPGAARQHFPAGYAAGGLRGAPGESLRGTADDDDGGSAAWLPAAPPSAHAAPQAPAPRLLHPPPSPQHAPLAAHAAVAEWDDAGT